MEERNSTHLVGKVGGGSGGGGMGSRRYAAAVAAVGPARGGVWQVPGGAVGCGQVTQVGSVMWDQEVEYL